MKSDSDNRFGCYACDIDFCGRCLESHFGMTSTEIQRILEKPEEGLDLSQLTEKELQGMEVERILRVLKRMPTRKQQDDYLQEFGEAFRAKVREAQALQGSSPALRFVTTI